MKKTLALVVSIILIVALVSAGAYAAQAMTFKDVKTGDWFKPYVDKLSGMSVGDETIISGYGNGLYGPQDNLQVDQLLKLVVMAMGYNPEACDTDKYWACRFIKKAKELGLVEDGEFTDYKRKITRGEIARIIARGMSESFPANLEEYKSLIKDYANIAADQQQYILKVYCKGIVNGYPNGNFIAANNATRAEASKMIVCLVDPTKRVLPTLPTAGTEVIRGYTIPVERTATVDTSSSLCDVGISIRYHNPLEIQFAEAQSVLQSKFDADLVNDIMSYVKQKKERHYDLAAKTFTTPGYEIYVVGGGWTATIIVYKI